MQLALCSTRIDITNEFDRHYKNQNHNNMTMTLENINNKFARNIESVQLAALPPHTRMSVGSTVLAATRLLIPSRDAIRHASCISPGRFVLTRCSAEYFMYDGYSVQEMHYPCGLWHGDWSRSWIPDGSTISYIDNRYG